MSDATLFTICSNLVLPGWVLLAVAPRWRFTRLLINSCVLPLVLAVVYVYLLVTSFGSGEGSFSDFGSLEGIRRLFTDDRALLAGWVHYLAFDLFIGSWEVRDAQRLKIPHLAVLPCLFLTLMAGPTGLLLYFTLRWTLRRRLLVEGA